MSRRPASGQVAPVAVHPDPMRHGVRWIATAGAAVLVTSVVVGLSSEQGPRPLPLVMTGVAVVLAGLLWDRSSPTGALAGTSIVVGLSLLAVGAEAWVDPTGAGLDVHLGLSGLVFVGVGMLRDDRRPVVLGIVQWAIALGRARPDDDIFRHCLVARDLLVPLPRVLPLVLLGVVTVAAAMVLRVRGHRLDAARGAESLGLGLALGGLAAKALELPGHPSLCGTGDAVDEGWAVLLLIVAGTIAWFGVRTRDAAWAAAGLGTVALTGIVATTLERNPVWGALTFAPIAVVLVVLERRGVVWPRRRGWQTATPWQHPDHHDG